MNYNIERILWRDIYSAARWMSIEEAKIWAQSQYEQKMETIGYVIYENHEFVVTAATVDPTNPVHPAFNDVSMIMKSVVLERTILSTSPVNRT